MKKISNIVSIVSITIFMILFILKFFDVLKDINTIDFRNMFVLIYLVSRLKYLELEIKDKNKKIKRLKSKLKR